MGFVIRLKDKKIKIKLTPASWSPAYLFEPVKGGNPYEGPFGYYESVSKPWAKRFKTRQKANDVASLLKSEHNVTSIIEKSYKTGRLI